MVTETVFSRSGLWKWWKRLLRVKEVFTQVAHERQADAKEGWMLHWSHSLGSYRGKPNDFLVKMRGITLIFNSNYAFLSKTYRRVLIFWQKFRYSTNSSEICHFLTRGAAVFPEAVVDLFYAPIATIITCRPAGSHPVWQMWAIFWEPLFAAQKDSTTGTWALEGSEWRKL